MKRPELLAKRELLLQRIANQREDVKMVSSSFKRPLALVDIGYSVVQQIRLHPYYFLGTAALAAIILRKNINITKIGFTALTWLFSVKKIPNQPPSFPNLISRPPTDK